MMPPIFFIYINTASAIKKMAKILRSTCDGKAWAILAPNGANNTLVTMRPKNAGQ